MSMDIFVGLATIIAGIIAAIQLFEWYKKQKRMRKRRRTLQISLDNLKLEKEPVTIINFTHPLTRKNIEQIKSLLNLPIEEIIEITTQLDEDDSFKEQIEALVNRVGFTSEQWQTKKFIIHLPGFAPAAAALIAELHGRIGHFPTILRLRSVPGTIPREFELAEAINLQNVRDQAREKR